MSALNFDEALEIMVAPQSQPLVKKLITENEALKKELAYFQAYLLSGDGKLCSVCEKVRHVDDMIIARDVHGDEIEGLFCSKKCAEKAAREYESDSAQNEFDEYLWRVR